MRNIYPRMLLYIALVSVLILSNSACNNNNHPEPDEPTSITDNIDTINYSNHPELDESTSITDNIDTINNNNHPEPDEPTSSIDNIDTILDFLSSKSLINLAREQAITQDYTPLASPAIFKILLIGYTNVSYGGVTYSMIEAQRKYVDSVANNFKASVEKASGYNVTITIDVKFSDSLLNIPTITSPDELIYIDQEYITDDLQRYGVDDQYDSVLTTSAMPDSLAILGVKTAGVDNHFGYSYFTLGNPTDIPDMSEPTALATLVAIHEWLHQLEGYRDLLGIDFPDIHAYLGANNDPEYANYEKYLPDTVGDWWYFYRDVLAGKVLYKGQKYIGMFPSMWYVTPRSLDKRFTIRNAANDLYLSITDAGISLDGSPENIEAQWLLTDYDGYVRLMPACLSGWCLDIKNANAFEGNEVKLFTCWERSVEYINAQLWSIIPNNDGTLICSKLDQSLVLSLGIQNDIALTLEIANGNAQQSWIMEPVAVTASSN